MSSIDAIQCTETGNATRCQAPDSPLMDGEACPIEDTNISVITTLMQQAGH